jgi:glc operon protein GlcG
MTVLIGYDANAGRKARRRNSFGEMISMRMRSLTAAAIGAAWLCAGAASAQQPPAPPNLDAVPEKMPWATPYGPRITAARAQAAIEAAVAEATKRGWDLNIAVVSPGGGLIAFLRMDNAQIASISIAEHRARVAARYRRPTKVFEDAVQKAGLNYILTLDDVIASRGGIPLIENDKIIGAIGCSGGTGSQDEVVCQAGAATINK